MKRSEVVDILIDWNFWGNFAPKIKERKRYLDRLKLISKGKEISVIKGVRRAGKSFIAYNYLSSLLGKEKNGLIINLEDPRFPNSMSVEDLNFVLKVYLSEINPSYPKIVVIDEVQKVEGWERICRFLSENKAVKLIITGSSSKLMSEEYATVLTGRHLDMEVFPLSFKEFLLFKEVQFDEKLEVLKKKFKLMNLLNEYLRFGGFPEVVLSDSEERKVQLLNTYLGDILVKDIIKRFKIKKIVEIEEIAKFLISNISSIVSLNKMAKDFRISPDTSRRFLKYTNIARLFFYLDSFDYSVRKMMKSRKKVYSIDVGFHNSYGFKLSENIGRIIENVVAVDLIRKSSFSPTTEIFYWKDYQQREVDFVIKQGLKVKQLIQVTYASGLDEVEKRELRSLVKAAETFKKDKPELLVITWDLEDEIKFKGKKIRFVPLWKWLLFL